MRIFREELFGPAVAVTPAADAATRSRSPTTAASASAPGSSRSDVERALRYARALESGVVHVNAAPPWRADLMPYGGVKQSGVGIEGPRYAVQEMTEVRTVVFNQS